MTEQLRYNEGKTRWTYIFSEPAWDPEPMIRGLPAEYVLRNLRRFLLCQEGLGYALEALESLMGGPTAAAAGYCAACVYGESKYARGNYLLGSTVCKYLDSAIRHLLAATTVEAEDEESGLPHLYHAYWNIVRAKAMLEAGRDDRLRAPEGA